MKVRKILAVPLAALMVALGVVSTAPGNATPNSTTTTSTATAVPDGATVATDLGSEESQSGVPGQHTGWKLGRLPAASTLCVANGVDAYFKSVILRLNNNAYGPNISVLNRCDGYSIQNRMTIDNYSAAGTTCVAFANTHRTYDAAQGYALWDQNVILKYNTSDYCLGSQPVMDHRIVMYLEYVLGLQYVNSTNYFATICSTSWCFYNVRYPTNHDWTDLGGIYGRDA